MKRNKFIATLAALASIPSLSFAEVKKTFNRNGVGFKIMQVKEGFMDI